MVSYEDISSNLIEVHSIFYSSMLCHSQEGSRMNITNMSSGDRASIS